MTTQEPPPNDPSPNRGRVVLLTRNSIAEAIDTIATTSGRRVTVIEQTLSARESRRWQRVGLRDGDAMVLCCHEALDAPGPA